MTESAKLILGSEIQRAGVHLDIFVYINYIQVNKKSRRYSMIANETMNFECCSLNVFLIGSEVMFQIFRLHTFSRYNSPL